MYDRLNVLKIELEEHKQRLQRLMRSVTEEGRWSVMNIHWVISAALATVLTACQNSEIELQLIENMDSETVISDTNMIS